MIHPRNLSSSAHKILLSQNGVIAIFPESYNRRLDKDCPSHKVEQTNDNLGIAKLSDVGQNLCMRVFISSTCYDLIDLRAELEMFFRESGVTPILSDSITSEFQALPDRNSIESCLANLETCDVVLVILSNRYGPSLKQAGYADLSATHLEYQYAVKTKKPIHMYVRDRLEGDFNIWRSNSNNAGLNFLWCKDSRLFQLIDEHKALVKGTAQSNWYWTFRTSVELKQRLAIDFKETFGRVRALRMLEMGQVPFLEIASRVSGLSRGQVELTVDVRNFGVAPALHPCLELVNGQNRWELQSIPAGGSTGAIVEWAFLGHRLNLSVTITYSVLEGYEFRDEGILTVAFTPQPTIRSSYKPVRRLYVGPSSRTAIAVAT